SGGLGIEPLRSQRGQAGQVGEAQVRAEVVGQRVLAQQGALGAAVGGGARGAESLFVGGGPVRHQRIQGQGVQRTVGHGNDLGTALYDIGHGLHQVAV